jgi:hypothetical protein
VVPGEHAALQICMLGSSGGESAEVAELGRPYVSVSADVVVADTRGAGP